MVDGQRLHGVVDVAPAAWIAPRLSGPLGTVTGTVPAGYPAYARLCHPPADEAGHWVHWAEAAAETGRQAHPTMQWHALVGTRDSLNLHDSLWRGEHPPRGELPPQLLAALCDALAPYTSTPTTCWFCLWDGYGWIRDSPSVRATGSDDPSSPVSLEQWRGPRVEHPSAREYLLFTGPLRAALRMGWWPTPDWFEAQSPNLFWPEDRAWCVGSEIDFDSTLIAGSPELTATLLRTPIFDAWPIEPTDSLTEDSDRLNTVP